MKMPTGGYVLPGLDEYTVIARDHSIKSKEWDDWVRELGTTPKYELDWINLTVTLDAKIKPHYEVLLPQSDIDKGWKIIWE